MNTDTETPLKPSACFNDIVETWTADEMVAARMALDGCLSPASLIAAARSGQHLPQKMIERGAEASAGAPSKTVENAVSHSCIRHCDEMLSDSSLVVAAAGVLGHDSAHSLSGRLASRYVAFWYTLNSDRSCKI